MAATVSDIPGTGYGNDFVNALVSGKTWSGTVTFYWGGPADYAAADDSRKPQGIDTVETWTDGEKFAFSIAIGKYSDACGVKFAFAQTAAEANLVWWKADLDQEFALHDEPRADQSWGFFNSHLTSWNNLGIGGDGLNTIMSALGMGLGLTPVEDAPDFPVQTPLFTWNQGVFTVMTSLDTGSEGSLHDETYGAQSGPGALDVAALQVMYGANTTTRTGNDTYALPIGNKPGTGWTAIVDAGGNDTITAEAATNRVSIDLRAATLAVGDQAAGGYRSSEFVTSGGFTIARGTVIENAIGGSNGDDLMGNDAGNMLRGNGGQDKIWGYAGNDLIYGDAAYDQIWAGLGNDTVFGGTDDDTLKGEDGNDQLFGETGWDDLYGGAGDDVLIGASGQDKLFGEDGNDLIRGDEEIDKIFAGSGNDTVNGGTESDQIDGEAGDDIVHGDDGHDYLRGDAGNDFLFGDIGADNIRGGAGNDMLCGGLNGDYLYGEAGKDIFFFDARPNKGAVDVLDFNVRDDTIKLSKSAFKLKAGTLNKNAFFKGAHAHDGDDRVIYNPKAGTLVYDADGTGSRAEVVLAKIGKKLAFTHLDVIAG